MIELTVRITGEAERKICERAVATDLLAFELAAQLAYQAIAQYIALDSCADMTVSASDVQ